MSNLGDKTFKSIDRIISLLQDIVDSYGERDTYFVGVNGTYFSKQEIETILKFMKMLKVR